MVLQKRLSIYLPSRLVKILLQPDSIAQIFGQLVLNTQRLDIWGTDLFGTLCVLQGGGKRCGKISPQRAAGAYLLKRFHLEVFETLCMYISRNELLGFLLFSH